MCLGIRIEGVDGYGSVYPGRITRGGVQSSSDYLAPDTPAILIQRHCFEMIRNEKKVQVPSVQ